MAEQYPNWYQYYRAKGSSSTDLRTVSGYTHGLAVLSAAGLDDITNLAKKTLTIGHTDTVLDVGCGAGLITRQLLGIGLRTLGLDINKTMLQHARGVEGLDLIQGSADRLPFPDNSVDRIFCHSIFQYFPNHEYASRVIAEIKRVLKPSGKGLIMDLPDEERKAAYEQVKEPDTHNLIRLFYEQQWFEQQGPGVTTFNEPITDYLNSLYRFNVVISA